MRPCAVGIDLGGTQVRAGLFDEDGNVIKRKAISTAASAGPDVVLNQLLEAAMIVSEGVPIDHIVGVGVSAPGPLDAQNGIALSIPTLAGFVNVPLTRMLEDRIGLPVWLENDGIAAAFGEWRFGVGRGYSSFVYLTVSTGIGGGVVSDGRLLRGRQGMAGHVGHMTIIRDGEQCPCGNKGCWEAYGSGPAFARRAQERAKATATKLLLADEEPIDGRAVFAAAAKGDALACELVLEEADILGIGITNLLHLYSPEVVVIGGGMANEFDVLHPGIVARIRSSAMPPFRDTPIVRAALGENSGLVGAAALAFDAARDREATKLPKVTPT
jgi:glucokinase